MGMSWPLALLSRKTRACDHLSDALQWQVLRPNLIGSPLSTYLGFCGSQAAGRRACSQSWSPSTGFLLPKAQGPDQNTHCYNGRAIQLLWVQCFMLNFYCCFYRTPPPPTTTTRCFWWQKRRRKVGFSCGCHMHMNMYKKWSNPDKGPASGLYTII